MKNAKTLIVTTGSTGAPLFATPATAEATAATITALEQSETWGQFLRALPKDIATEVRECFEEGELPEADDEFDPSDVPGFDDGDFPTWIGRTMLDEVPAPIITRFGVVAESVHNGRCVEFRAEDLSAIVAALKDLGYEVIERHDLSLEVA